MPGTFSITNPLGLYCFTISITARYSLFRGSSKFLGPVTENPWQGGPAIMTSIFLLPESSFILSKVSCCDKSAFKAIPPLWFSSNVFNAGWLLSTPTRTLYPASRKPFERPPHPQNKSMQLSFGGVEEVSPFGVHFKRSFFLLQL